jgi:hypothetical protein
MMEGFQNQLRERPANQDTVHFKWCLVNDREANIRQMFSQVQLSNLQISVPTALTSALDKISNAGPRGTRPQDDDDQRTPTWHVTKPMDDSPEWLANIQGRKSFNFYFGQNDKGNKNRAALANIRCKHHTSGRRSNRLLGICPEYVAGGACAKPDCKLVHFLKRRARQLAHNSNPRAKELIQELNAFFTHLYST